MEPPAAPRLTEVLARIRDHPHFPTTLLSQEEAAILHSHLQGNPDYVTLKVAIASVAKGERHFRRKRVNPIERQLGACLLLSALATRPLAEIRALAEMPTAYKLPSFSPIRADAVDFAFLDALEVERKKRAPSPRPASPQQRELEPHQQAAAVQRLQELTPSFVDRYEGPDRLLNLCKKWRQVYGDADLPSEIGSSSAGRHQAQAALDAILSSPRKVLELWTLFAIDGELRPPGLSDAEVLSHADQGRVEWYKRIETQAAKRRATLEDDKEVSKSFAARYSSLKDQVQLKREMEARTLYAQAAGRAGREKERLLREAMACCVGGVLTPMNEVTADVTYISLLVFSDLLPMLSAEEAKRLGFLILMRSPHDSLTRPPLSLVHRVFRGCIPLMDKSQQTEVFSSMEKFMDRVAITVANYFTLLIPDTAVPWFFGGQRRLYLRPAANMAGMFYWPSFSDLLILATPAEVNRFSTCFQSEIRPVKLPSGLPDKAYHWIAVDTTVYITVFNWLTRNHIRFIDIFYDETGSRRCFLPDRVQVKCDLMTLQWVQRPSDTLVPDEAKTIHTLRFSDSLETVLLHYLGSGVSRVFPAEIQDSNGECCEECTPRDPLFAQQWSLSAGPEKRPEKPASPVLDLVRATHIALRTDGRAPERIRIAIVDSGLYRHNDLPHVSFHRDPAVTPTRHGTDIAQIISARANDFGIVGVASVLPAISAEVYQVSLWMDTPLDQYVKVLDRIISSASSRPDQNFVVNLSWRSPPNPALEETVSSLCALRNVLVVAAAGNEHSARLSFPATVQGVIAVAGLDRNNHKSDRSSFGPRVDISAPGCDIITTHDGQAVVRHEGTSYAAAHVTGVCALMWACAPSLSASEIKEKLLASAGTITDPSYDSKLGRGFVDARHAMILVCQQ